MYLSYFGFNELPFGITPDTQFAFAGNGHQEALNTLLVALKSGEGFIKITGEVGTGKTLLCRRFLAALGKEYVSAYLPNPYLAPNTLFMAVLEELGTPYQPQEYEFNLLKTVNKLLLDFARKRKVVVLCIDEAQAMPLETLEALRLLSNLETEKRKLLHLVLFGQPELDAKLADPSVRQLRQRIAFHYRLTALKRDELHPYLGHRLRVAGYRGEGLFAPAAVRLIHYASRGTPRLVNILAHKALLSVFGEGRMQVTARHVRTAARDTEEARLPWWLTAGIL
ncbi:MAG: AAA family ATPase [Burkholderiales bacterium]|nr:AAA family ATPase [Burkholderiales bacterium]